MKKSVWVVGLLVVIGAGLLISRERVQKEIITEGTEHTEGESETRSEAVKDGNITKRNGKSAQSVDTGGQTGKSAPQLSDAVKALLLQDGREHNYQTLLAAISEFGSEMSAADVNALMEMLNFPNDRFPEKMRPIEINAIKNDVLDKLLRQKQLPEGIGLQMVEMANNPENDPVWRDYCVQFMEPFYERVAEERGTTEYTEDTEGQSEESAQSVDELTAIQDAMFSALGERNSTIAGTALIGLENLSRTHDEFDREAIVAKASEIALDETASAASRLTALRLSAEIGTTEYTENTEIVEAARSVAQTGETVLLRSAAIVTLGEVGTPDDRELLESYLLDENKQIADAAKMALAKMDSEASQLVEQIDPEIIGKTAAEPQSAQKIAPILIN